jgi:hypothetical protein
MNTSYLEIPLQQSEKPMNLNNAAERAVFTGSNGSTWIVARENADLFIAAPELDKVSIVSHLLIIWLLVSAGTSLSS